MNSQVSFECFIFVTACLVGLVSSFFICNNNSSGEDVCYHVCTVSNKMDFDVLFNEKNEEDRISDFSDDGSIPDFNTVPVVESDGQISQEFLPSMSARVSGGNGALTPQLEQREFPVSRISTDVLPPISSAEGILPHGGGVFTPQLQHQREFPVSRISPNVPPPKMSAEGISPHGGGAYTPHLEQCEFPVSRISTDAVSYTHLTLPTICSV